jgi:hypothetical protein
VNPEALESDCAALIAAGSLAEEALALHREALAIVEQGWHSQSGSAATDALRRQCGEAAELVTALHDATGDFRALRDTAEYGVEASIAEPYNRLSDRPPAQFDTAEPFILAGAPVPPPGPVPPPPAPAWTTGTAGPPLPDVGGALVGLVAQIVDAVSSISVEEGAGLETSLPTEPPADPPTEPPAESPAAPPEPESPALPAVSPPVQFVGPSAPPESPALPPPIAAPPPLLAAERPPDPPPEPRPASPPAPEVPTVPLPEPPPEQPPEQPPEDPKTPCEIAADALPQVGQ